MVLRMVAEASPDGNIEHGEYVENAAYLSMPVD
jgi:hypothetical protein